MDIFENIPTLSKASLAAMLRSRVTDEKKLSEIPNPALLHDAPKAAKKIAEAVREGKKIALVGDYDVDGVSATAIMADFFRQIPYPLETFIPNRFHDGYGFESTKAAVTSMFTTASGRQNFQPPAITWS